ncbi:integrase, catalytic region, zinc finger, CCHC-type containing protein [Tanacetum coccineum]
MSYECNNIKLAIWNDKSEVMCATCNKCLIIANQDVCVFKFVNGMKSRGKTQNANISNIEKQKKQKTKVKNIEMLGSKESLASHRPRKPRTCFSGKLLDKSNTKAENDKSACDNASASNPQEPKSNRFPNSTSFLGWLSKFVYGVSTQLGFTDGLNDSQQKPVPNSQNRLHLLHMDLSGPIRVKSINEKRYILVLLQALVIIVRSDNGTIFMNQVLKAYFEDVFITHQTSTVRTPQQNEVVESKNRTLVEVARTMLLFFSASLFLSDDVVATNDQEDIGKVGAKGGLELTYAPSIIIPHKPTERNLELLFETMYDYYMGSQPSDATRNAPSAPVTLNCQTPNASTRTAKTSLTLTNSSTKTPAMSHPQIRNIAEYNMGATS